MQEQSSLGNREIVKADYNQTQIGRVTSTSAYVAYGRIEVAFLDYSKPSPVWVVGSLDRMPEPGDLVLVGYIQGRADSPYLAGFVRNESYTANYVRVEKDQIILQIPQDSTDAQGHLLDDSLQNTRPSIILRANGVSINGSLTVSGIINCTELNTNK